MFLSQPPPRRRRVMPKAPVFHKSTNIITWPADKVPVEIFTLIASYLPRSTIQNMRLVNREFEAKVSEYLFRVVVVPFKSEIYGISSALHGEVSDSAGSVTIQDKGMKVFEGFGSRIRKFALSFEYDEYRLAYPPLKSDQEAITTFWGIYRWPFQNYNRYTQLEGLEQTADETRTMAKALGYLKTANELGLSIDGGLGWLPGPDVNALVVEKGEKPVVFGLSRFVPDPRHKPTRCLKTYRACDPASAFSQSNTRMYHAYESMLIEAGYHEDNVDAGVRLMMETETSSEVEATTNSDGSAAAFTSYASQAMESIFRHMNSPDFVPCRSVNDLIDIQKHKTSEQPLKPNDLTNAQKEMLLEIEWAQRAFLQSYAVAVIDNPSTFENIRTLTIARLPSGHLPTLRRGDFWQSLKHVEKLSLGVIPDWREISKQPAGWVQDQKTQPSLAVTVAYQIFHEQIARRANIKTLHFEWICGGEYATGMYSRNQLILPAPLVRKPTHMVCRTRQFPVLYLPFVEHLSLKNCWVSPHVLNDFFENQKYSLQSLKFDSVSLSAPIPMLADPGPGTQIGNGAGGGVPTQGAIQHAAAFAQATAVQQALQAPQPAVNFPNGPPNIQQLLATTDPVPNGLEWLAIRFGSWSQLIDNHTPGRRLADIRYDRNIGEEPMSRPSTKLKKMEFHSCGYVRVNLDFEQSMLDSPDAPGLPLAGKKDNNYGSIMLNPNDYYLATIVNHISHMETATLENAWNIEVGWPTRLKNLVAESKFDGIPDPGKGRFAGVIEATNLN
ncbi:hypothetical protein GLAREA_04527 [Glarea lozoyensis ATCC 20868]|uniref:F-box domain-containing protein n=1 Tax=Glarea lozoyensis (strain ATCC 20868 / MF5171) TaxID=1116229 RepID=S3D6U5_GLAL2|nr:uncharacterized protein GLAREA_04527 [Glarea lozoyensis ATCC 20868]EPE27736.1 hypothetical protein GLAREA_04527 [Glarea lozoyensis ATCC 20868]